MSESVVDEPFACPNCGKSSDEHPTMDVSNAKTIFLCQDRAPKWRRVEPGTVIPAGQPYRVETPRYSQTASEFCDPTAWTAVENTFVDSSWKPPLVLPTEPTWGIVATKGYRTIAGRWHRLNGVTFFNETAESVSPDDMVAWIPFTDEQVAHIEAAR